MPQDQAYGERDGNDARDDPVLNLAVVKENA